MKTDGKQVGSRSPADVEVFTSKRRGSIPVAPVIRHADDKELVRKFAKDAERLAEVSDGTRSRLLAVGFGAVLVLALTAVVVAKKADSSEGQILEPAPGLDYEDPILDGEVSCLRTEFKDRVDGTTSAWKEANCNTDALGELDNLSSIFIARSNLGTNAEEWIRDCEGGTDCSMVTRVGGRVFNPSIDKKFVKPVPRYGVSYTRRIYSK